MKITERPIWHCPRCGAPFVNRNQSHSCVNETLEKHFERSESHVREVFDLYLAMVEEHGPVTVIPQKTRVAFAARVRFTSATPKKDHILCTFIFHEADPSPRFHKIEFIPPNYHVHYLKVHSLEELDDDVRRWIAETWRYGRQDRLK